MAALRGPAMKSISIMWAEGVTESEAATVVNTVKQIVQVMYDLCFKAGVGLSPTAIRPFGTWVMPSIPAGDPYSGTRWYIETAYDRALGQVVAPRFLELVKQEPWQIANPHFDVAVLDLDLTDGTGPVMGSSLPGTATVISVQRLRALADQDARLSALRRLVVHNFGHVLGIPREGRLGVIDNGRERHCTSVCAMRDASGVEELVAMAREEAAVGLLLCQECRQDLVRAVLAQRVPRN
jgi:predicted Zn-dependent protease